MRVLFRIRRLWPRLRWWLAGTIIVYIVLIDPLARGLDWSKFATEWTLANRPLWDWLELLFVPAVLAFSISLLNRQAQITDREIAAAERENHRMIAEKRRLAEIEIAKQARAVEREISKRRDEERSLEAYFGRIGDLMEKGLGSRQEPVLEALAQAHTDSVMRRLGAERKGHVIRFLSETGLYTTISIVKHDLSEVRLPFLRFIGINLMETDIKNAYLVYAELKGANLSSANLSGSDLSHANLEGADLSGADLTKTKLLMANLADSKLAGSKLAGAIFHNTTMPDGQMWYPGMNLGQFT